jgi:four helix bundle protein
MAIARSFEELECWQEARELVKLVFAASDTGKLSRDFGTANQMKRAAISVMNNIAEGHARKGGKEFMRFLEIAQSSALEVKSMTYILDDLDYLPRAVIEAIREKAEKVKKMIRGLVRFLEERERLSRES